MHCSTHFRCLTLSISRAKKRRQPPETPKDRVEISQNTMRKVFKDPEFRAEFQTLVTDAVKDYRQFYNYERLHMSLGYRTPAAVYLNEGGQKL